MMGAELTPLDGPGRLRHRTHHIAFFARHMDEMKVLSHEPLARECAWKRRTTAT